MVLQGCKNSERVVTKIAEGIIILKDTSITAAGTVEKQRLVQLYPAKLFWVSTHLTGPNKHSQFLYQISSDGKNGSFLDFSALNLQYDGIKDAEVLAARLFQEDSEAWQLLAKALSKELAQK